MIYGRISQYYKRTTIETSGKLDLIIMCYEKSIELLTQAKNHFKGNEFEEKTRKMQKAIDILNELQGCLDMEKGGEIARNLDAIYTYLNRRLLQGDLQKDLSLFDECVDILNELKSAWEAISSPQKESPIKVMEGPVESINNYVQNVA